jgi:hypothetical protein
MRFAFVKYVSPENIEKAWGLAGQRFNAFSRKQGIPEIVNVDALFCEIYKTQNLFRYIFLNSQTPFKILLKNKTYKKMHKKYGSEETVAMICEMFEFLRNPNFVLNKKKREIEANNFEDVVYNVQFFSCNFLVPSLTDPSVLRNKEIVIPWDILNEIFSYINPYTSHHFGEDVANYKKALMCVNGSFYFQVLQMSKKLNITQQNAWLYPLYMMKNVTDVTITKPVVFSKNTRGYLNKCLCKNVKRISAPLGLFWELSPEIVFVKLKFFSVQHDSLQKYGIEPIKKLSPDQFPSLKSMEFFHYCAFTFTLFERGVFLGLKSACFFENVHVGYMSSFENCEKIGFGKGCPTNLRVILQSCPKIKTLLILNIPLLNAPINLSKENKLIKRLIIGSVISGAFSNSPFDLCHKFTLATKHLMNAGNIEEYVFEIMFLLTNTVDSSLFMDVVEFIGFGSKEKKGFCPEKLLEYEKRCKDLDEKYPFGIPPQKKTFKNTNYYVTTVIKKKKYDVYRSGYFRKMEIHFKKI